MDRDLKILIVEDVPKDAQAMEAALREEGVRFQTRCLETRKEFLQALEEFKPDVVLSDFTMPEFDALEALRLLQERHADIPLILVTGSRSEEVAVECIKEGADDYILKASLKRLPSSLHNVLEKKAAERERRRAEAALRRSEEQFRLIAEHSHDLISLLDGNGRFVYASPAFGKVLGYAPEELAGCPAADLVHPEDRATLQRSLQEALSCKTGVAAEYRFKHRNGHWHVFESTGNWILDEKGAPHQCVMVSRDIAQRKQSEEILRGLPRLIRQAQEAERRRVARELHDSVNQMLAAAKFRVQAVEEQLADQAPTIQQATLDTRRLLEKAMNEVRRISHNLRPSELDDLGLAPAVRSLGGEFAERTGIEILMDVQELPDRFRKATELDLYRIIQEALNNIEQHAQATRVWLEAHRVKGQLQISIRDNGRGFDPASTQTPRHPGTGMGLVDMRERAAFLRAAFTLETAPGQGTTVRLQIPARQISA